ncbi:hypothetical protein [uncultured Gimesia sp.]|uniref:hypothetical protein n=1 Tax=uncultured Gimesia sp. TaxID=1678688 RepID=UPI0026311A94|nr:hypothetical protein [uncultured Gimesia sp.]
MKSNEPTTTEITKNDSIARIFRTKKSDRNEALVSLIFFTLFGTGSTYLMWFMAHPDSKMFAVIAFSVIWSPLVGIFIWSFLVCQYRSITIQKETVILQGVFSCKEIDLSRVLEARWKLIGSGVLTLKTLTEKGSVHLLNFEREDRLWLIQYFRSHLPESIQQNWDLFCLKVAIPLRDPKPKVFRDPGPDEILITRKRYDRFGIPLIIISIICGVLTAWYFKHPKYLSMPVILIIFWVLLRNSIPKEGKVFSKIGSDKESMEVVKLLGWWIGLVIILLITYRLPILPQPQHTILGNCLMLIYMVFLFVKARPLIRSNKLMDLEKSKKAVQQWKDCP